MQCPSCNSYKLKPTKLDYSLPARACNKCGGVLISLLNYRAWAEDSPDKLDDSNSASVTVEENEKALVCKKMQQNHA